MNSENSKCPVCGSGNTKAVFSRSGQPVSRFWNEAGNIPEIDLVIAQCHDCKMVFQESAYTDRGFDAMIEKIYRNYQLLSADQSPFPSNERYYTDASDYLISKISHRNVTNVLEIGSNRGDFLYHLKARISGLNVIGVEPSRLPFYGVPTVNRYFDEGLFGNSFDLIVLRHVVEHIKDPVGLLKRASRLLSDEGLVFIEVPNFRQDISESMETFIVEHVGYYFPEPMRRLIESAGLSMREENTENPNGLYCIAEKKKNGSRKPAVRTSVDAEMDGFMSSYRRMIREIKSHADEGVDLCIYGFGNVFFGLYSSLKTDLPSLIHDGRLKCIFEDTVRDPKRFNGIDVMNFKDFEPAGKCLFIVCTMNRAHMGRMKEKITKKVDRPIIMAPWQGRI